VGARHLKKSGEHIGERASVQYAMIQKQAQEKQGSVNALCKFYGVSRSGYYQWLKPKETAHQKRDEILVAKVESVFRKNKGRYGSPRVTKELRYSGTPCSKRRVSRLMKSRGLKVERKPSFRPKTTIRRKDELIAPNRLENQPLPQKPNEVWVSDITYIPLEEGWVYLVVWMDLFSRMIVGWKIGEEMKTDLVQGALEQAIQRRKPPQGITIHADRGTQYTSRQMQEYAKKNKLIQSMSSTGYCFDNAHVESFWSSLKNETIPDRGYFLDFQEARMSLFEYLEGYYNRTRLHSSLGYLSPMNFEQKQTDKN
jgi:transposase InsO family protein